MSVIGTNRRGFLGRLAAALTVPIALPWSRRGGAKAATPESAYHLESLGTVTVPNGCNELTVAHGNFWAYSGKETVLMLGTSPERSMKILGFSEDRSQAFLVPVDQARGA